MQARLLVRTGLSSTLQKIYMIVMLVPTLESVKNKCGKKLKKSPFLPIILVFWRNGQGHSDIRIYVSMDEDGRNPGFPVRPAGVKSASGLPLAHPGARRPTVQKSSRSPPSIICDVRRASLGGAATPQFHPKGGRGGGVRLARPPGGAYTL